MSDDQELDVRIRRLWLLARECLTAVYRRELEQEEALILASILVRWIGRLKAAESKEGAENENRS